MFAITFLPALGFTIGGVILGIYGAYLLFSWAMSEDNKRVPPPSTIRPNRIKLDFFEERIS